MLQCILLNIINYNLVAMYSPYSPRNLNYLIEEYILYK